MERREVLQQAIEEIARQRAEIERLRRETREPIAVVGMACRLPGAPTVDDFWALLARGGDAVAEVPRERWNAEAFYDADASAIGKMTTRQGAFIEGADQFDPQFFGIAPREAQSMDPQQRLLLEVAWEALENANIAPPDLYGTATGVFVGITCFDHAIRISQATENFNSYAGTGSALNMAPGRLSYVLGVTGPSMAVDTACSSSLVCLHLACQSLRQRESDMAIVGGVHLILSPHVMVSFSQARMLAADGRSKTFDASADGYSRGEGCGVVVLKRYSDAIANHDTILGVIRGTAVNQDGPSGGLTVPNGASQQKVIRRALDAAGLSPASVDYVEAHGTGTPLGDPIEVEALAKTYGEGRSSPNPLLIGSVKTNIGHLEPAAGMAGLIKILLAFQHQQIPRHLHFRTPNPHIPWSELPIKVTGSAVEWRRDGRPRIAGLSAFGFSGTNAHAIVEEPPQPVARDTTASQRACYVLPFSAKSEEALRAMASRYVSMFARSAGDLASIAYTAAVGRTHFPYRLVVFGQTTDDARQALGAFLANQTSPDLRSGKASSADYRGDATEVGARLARAYQRLENTDSNHRDALADVAALYLEGVAIDWKRLYGTPPPARVTTLPSYPFQRKRYWIETPDQTVASDAHVPSWLYQSVWVNVGAAATAGDVDPGRRWAIVPGNRELAERVHAGLVECGADASIVSARDAAAASATDVIFTAAVADPHSASASCTDLLAMVQALLLAAGASPRIWVVTRGAIANAAHPTLESAAQAPLAAFARVLGLEHPELFGRVIDLDPDGSTNDAATLLAEILHDDVEDQVAIRSGARYAQRIDHVADATGENLAVQPDATYLITGGLGRIGLQIARHLVERGARHLCLAGRNGIASPEQRSVVAAFEEQGARVRIAMTDVADRDAMTRLFREIAEGPPLRGVVHAAGLPGYADIEHLTAESVAAVLRPKVAGAWLLHELTRDLSLDFFVCCSSIASAWGSRGQAHYAAANAFLDALAHLRRTIDLPAVTINWGPWRDGGMTSPEAETLLKRVGIRSLPTRGALEAFDRVARSGHAQIVVADVDWQLFKGSYEARGHRRLLERLKVVSEEASAVVESELVRRVNLAPPAERERLLVDVVQREVAQVLALAEPSQVDPDQGLFEMGMDSLMALELRTRLQTLVSRALPATLVFDCPSIQAISRYLVGELGGTINITARHSVTPLPAVPSVDFDALSDEDAEALLLKKLESIP